MLDLIGAIGFLQPFEHIQRQLPEFRRRVGLGNRFQSIDLNSSSQAMNNDLFDYRVAALSTEPDERAGGLVSIEEDKPSERLLTKLRVGVCQHRFHQPV